jgi:DNA polymerase-4
VEASRAVFALFARAAPVVEGLSMEEAFLDVTGAAPGAGSPEAIAARLRRDVRERVGLPITVGVARTKILAKLASRAAKPDGLLVVPPDGERAFLHPRPVEELWGVGPVAARRLRARGITTVGHAARLGEAALIAILGTGPGRQVHALAHNRDRGPVRPNRPRRSVGSQHALGRSRRSPAELDALAADLVDRVARRLWDGGLAGRTVVLRLRFDDFSRASRSHTLPAATAAGEPILATVRALLAAAAPAIERRGLTLVGVTATNLVDVRGAVQLALGLDACRDHKL